MGTIFSANFYVQTKEDDDGAKKGSAKGGKRAKGAKGGESDAEQDSADDGDELASKRVKKGTGSTNSATVIVLSPNIYRLKPYLDSECTFLSADDAGQVIETFTYEFESGLHEGSDGDNAADEFRRFRSEIEKLLAKHYPTRAFDNESLFAHSHRGSLKVLHVHNLPTLVAAVHKDKILRVAMGAPHQDEAPDGGYPTGSDGFILPPVKPTEVKGAVALAEHDLDVKVTDALKTLYFNEASPLYHGINTAHVPFVKAFLRQKTNVKILDNLIGGNSIFHGESVDDFLLKSTWRNGWMSTELMYQCHSIPQKGRFPPDASAKGVPKIPQIDFNKSKDPSGSGNSSGSSSSGSSSSGSGTISTG